MGAYLVDRRVTRQYRTVRRAEVNGQITLHTAESILDLIGADAGAENVANFIATRPDYGSYHQIGDRDSIVVLAPFEFETWHDATRYPDGTRANSRSVGISLAMEAKDWPKLSAEHRGQLLWTMVAMAVDAARWYRDVHGIVVPARRLTKGESDRGVPGFIGHGHRDPKRRRDPGAEFPWAEFLALYAAEMFPPAPIIEPPQPPTGDDDMPKMTLNAAMAEVAELYKIYHPEIHDDFAEWNRHMSDWGREMARLCYVDGDDPREGLRFLAIWFRDEHAQAREAG